MSGDSSSEKTEQPTAKKLRDLRKKGQVPASKEVVSAALVVGMVIYFYFSWPTIYDTAKAILLLPVDAATTPFSTAVSHLYDLLLSVTLKVLLPFIGIVVFVTILANILQNGIVTSMEPIKPDLNKINPTEGFKKIFSKSNFVDFLASILKVIIVSGCVAWVVNNYTDQLLNGPICGLNCLVSTLNSMLFDLQVYCVGVFVLIAIADLIFQRYNFTKQNMMTKDDVKRDHKDSDGDPNIKGKRRQLQRDIAFGKNMQNVEKATVVVRNPTHFAVAIRHHNKHEPLPIVVAKGEELVAQKIIEIAEEHGIPILENVPLARGLYATGRLGHYVPADFIPAVVEVLQWVKLHHPGFEVRE